MEIADSPAADPNVPTHISELDVQDLICYIEDIEMELQQRDEALADKSKEIERLVAEKRRIEQPISAGIEMPLEGSQNSLCYSPMKTNEQSHSRKMPSSTRNDKSSVDVSIISEASSSDSLGSERCSLSVGSSAAACEDDETETPRSATSYSPRGSEPSPSSVAENKAIETSNRDGQSSNGHNDCFVRTALSEVITRLHRAEFEVVQLRERKESRYEQRQTATEDAHPWDENEAWNDDGADGAPQSIRSRHSCGFITPINAHEEALPPPGAPKSSKMVQLLRRCCLPSQSDQVASAACIA